MTHGSFNFAAPTGGHVQVRWSNRHGLDPMEQEAELLYRSGSDYVISSTNPILENTPVYLSGESYMGNGIVRACERQESGYVLAIILTVDAVPQAARQEFDPGLLAVDDFLTEEEEAKILDSLKGEIPYSLTVQRAIHHGWRWSCRMQQNASASLRRYVFHGGPSLVLICSTLG